MKKRIETIVRFGVPVIVLLVTIYALFIVKDNSDPEFGAIGAGAGIFLLLVILLILYLVTGIIVWFVKKNNVIFQSAIFSGLAILVFLFIVRINVLYKENKSDKEFDKKYQQELNIIKHQIDSLSKIIIINPNNYKAIEERALLYLNTNDLYYKLSPKERDNYVTDLEFATLHKTSNINVYQKLANRYLFVNEHDKAIELYKNTLKNDSLKLLHFSDDEKKIILDELEIQKKEKRQYIKAIEQAKLQRENKIKTLTAKLEKEGLNSDDLAKRGYAYHFLNKEIEALADFNKAIELDPNNRMALSQRANVLVKLEKYNQAVIEYKALIMKYPNSNSIYEEELKKLKDKLN